MTDNTMSEEGRQNNLLNSQESYNLLAAAIEGGHSQEIDLLLEKGIGINEISQNGAHIVMRAIHSEKTLLKILSSPKLVNKKLIFKQLISYGESRDIYDVESATFVQIMEKFEGTQIPKEYLIELEIRLSMFAPHWDSVWCDYKRENNIEITPLDTGLYLLKKHHANYAKIISKDYKTNKKFIRQYQAYKSLFKTLLMQSDSQEALRDAKRYYMSLQKASSVFDLVKAFHCNVFINILAERSYTNCGLIELMYKHFMPLMRSREVQRDPKDYTSILDKYSLKSVVVPNNFSAQRVSELLDNNLPYIAKKFGIDSKILGAQQLSISFDTLNLREHDGMYLPRLQLIDILSRREGKALEAGGGHEYLLKEAPYFRNIFIHEYTHFMQCAGIAQEDIFQYHTVQKKWSEIKELFQDKWSRDKCIEFLMDKYVQKIDDKIIVETIKNLLMPCFKTFNTRYTRDKKYVKATQELVNYIRKINLEDREFLIQDTMSIINSYANQRCKNFQQEVWKNIDNFKLSGYYLQHDAEIHARLVQQFLGSKYMRATGLLNEHEVGDLRFLNNTEKSNIKVYLEEFHKLIIKNSGLFKRVKSKCNSHR